MARNLTHNQKSALSEAMMTAIKAKDIETLQGCIDMGGNVDSVATDGSGAGYRPLLHWMSSYFNEEIAELLLQHGDIEVKDNTGNTPLMRAVMDGKPEAVAFFMKHGADPLAENSSGLVILSKAQSTGDFQTRQKILKLLCQSPQKKTPEQDNKKDDFNAAALPKDTLVPTPLAKNPPKKDGGAMEF